MDLIIVFVLSFAFGWVLREAYAKYTLMKVFSKVESAVKQELDEKFARIIIEKQGEMFYAYSADDRTFMAQGITRRELEQKLAVRYPGKLFAATPDNLKEVGFEK